MLLRNYRALLYSDGAKGSFSGILSILVPFSIPLMPSGKIKGANSRGCLVLYTYCILLFSAFSINKIGFLNVLWIDTLLFYPNLRN